MLTQVTIEPGAEWTCAGPGWRVLAIQTGIAYWISSACRRELAVGEVLVFSPAESGAVRASQLGEVEICYYVVHPEILGGLLTLAERHLLETPALIEKNRLRNFLPGHPLAESFARLKARAEAETALSRRCQLLQLFAEALAEDLRHPQPPRRAAQPAQERFKQIMAAFSEQELLQIQPEELCLRCGCSMRHFTRLFRAHFGQSLRAKLTQLRIQKAQELLLSGSGKIAAIAYESGYRHLGLFNTTFKKHCGLTPRAWRRLHAGGQTG
mgnify:CR=1 FL=1